MSFTSKLFVVLASVGVVALWSGPLNGSVTSIAGKDQVKKEVRVVVNATVFPNVAYTVPDDRELVITDVIFHNLSAVNEVDLVLHESGTIESDVMAAIHLNTSGQFAHSFVVGPVVHASEDLKVIAVGTNPSLSIYVSGYLRKA